MSRRAARTGAAGVARERGIALLAVLFALMLLMMLALPFAVSMGVGADAAAREVEVASVEQASASVRDLLLADASLSHPALDETRGYDALDEWPDRPDLPAAFAPLQDEGRVLLGGEVWDLQRFVALDSVSPLVLANLLGTTTRLREVLTPDATSIAVEDAERLPDQGFLWLPPAEVVHYGSKDGANLRDVRRGLFPELGFATLLAPLAPGTIVLDYRCVLAAAWPFLGAADDLRQQRRPFAALGEINSIAAAGCGTFTQDELDVLALALSVDTQASTAPVWGRPERVFDALEPGKKPRMLRVKSAQHVGPGSTVRLRDLRSGKVEYNLVMATGTERSTTDLLLPSVFQLELLLPVVQPFRAEDTVVEPLVPAPVNINTAPLPVLTAMFAEVRRSADVRVHESDGRTRVAAPAVTKTQAEALAKDIDALRRGEPAPSGGAVATGPFQGFEDLVQRVFRPRLEAATSDDGKSIWLYLYRNLLTGRDSTIEMGTAPICFESGPWVGYRAAASRSRSAIAPGVAARHERTGLAVALPGFELEHDWSTQDALEEAFRLDRRAPYYVTTPINLGSPPPNDLGNDPASRYLAHIVPVAYPSLGLGEPRFARREATDSGIRLGYAVSRMGGWNIQGSPLRELRREDSMAQTNDPRGHDVQKDGPYLMENTGPSTRGGSGQSGGTRHDRITFPFSTTNGFADRFAVRFWFEPEALSTGTLFDHGDGTPDRNRIAVHARDGNLVFEVLDEAGLDPDASRSPAGIERTATEWTLPLAELNLPPKTPVHLSLSAYGSRPTELSFAVDGVARGKPKYVTYLTAALKAYDPNPALASNQGPPGDPANEKYLDVQVESTDGFPPVGVLRIGAELFEYSSIVGSSFRCEWKDSLGGRAARQAGVEHRPAYPVDENGKPTTDVAELEAQGISLDVFPDHPVGSMVELYGYSALPSEDSPMMPGKTEVEGAIGAWAVARGMVRQPEPIAITSGAFSLPLGEGMSATWTGDLELGDPVANPARDTAYPRPAAQTAIADAFAVGGGYALLMQSELSLTDNARGGTASVGGIEVVKYSSRQGNKLIGIQRAVQIPGDNGQIDPETYDGTARQFVCNWRLVAAPNTSWNEYPILILWVVPISLPVRNAGVLLDPAKTVLTEWAQLKPNGPAEDLEWVRYDCILEGRHLVRGNRPAWGDLYWQLTQRDSDVDDVGVGPGGAAEPAREITTEQPWPRVQATSGYIGYVPKLEADFPQIYEGRRALNFRGDQLSRTSSHAHSNAQVTACHRLQLPMGNYGAFTGRTGRHDRVALVQGSTASGAQRPIVEWHTVTWTANRYNADNLQRNSVPRERLGPWPFQLVGFDAEVRVPLLGPPAGTVVIEPRAYDRVVKFPSGELPAAFAETVAIGAGVGNVERVPGFVDEVQVTTQVGYDLIVDEAFDAAASGFKVDPAATCGPLGPRYDVATPDASLPEFGGLLQIDGEILAYRTRRPGEFEIAVNGRGLLNTEARGHDRGARVLFLTHRPAAILNGAVNARDSRLPVQTLGSLPTGSGTVLLGRELLHYTWVRRDGDRVTLEMPRGFPPGAENDAAAARGLFRARYGTVAQAGANGEAAIGFPIRHWDRHVERNDDPEQAYFQLTSVEAPVFYRSLSWREETSDSNVDVVCLVRVDGRAPWTADPKATPGLWQLERAGGDGGPSRLGAQGSRLEIRFATVYRTGACDLVAFTAHAWKTAPRIEEVRVQYEGQGRVLDERVTAR